MNASGSASRPAKPTLHRLARHPARAAASVTVTLGLHLQGPFLSPDAALVEHLEHRGVSLPHQIQLHQHDDPPGPTTSTQKHSPSASRVEHTYRNHCRPRTGPASQVSPSYRSHAPSIYRDRTLDHRIFRDQVVTMRQFGN